MNILITGGAGYIGSHTCVVLLQEGHTVIIADNLSNSKFETIEKIERISQSKVIFYEIDVTDEVLVKKIFSQHQIDGVIHFAGFKAVGESKENPLKYYYNNIVSTIVLSKVCLKFGVMKFVFSSSATVYGDNVVPFEESMKLLPTTNPYGETKVICERILSDLSYANPEFIVTILRYFNPIGAHESGLIGERPKDTPNNLLPYITKVAKGVFENLRIFGNDFKTEDGTGIRDYIHVVDLAEGHVAAIKKMYSGVHIYNLGTGYGTSVKELVNSFEKYNNITIPYEVVERRLGDISECYADVKKAEKELDWKAKRGIKDMVIDAWNFEKNNN